MVRSVSAPWVGIDVGKEFHWAHALDASGRKLFSHRVENDESDLLKLIDEVLTFTAEVVWSVDQPGGGAALLLALCCGRGIRASSISRASAWTALVTPTAGSPRPTPATPTSSPTPGTPAARPW
jgi:hypothetical protein